MNCNPNHKIHAASITLIWDILKEVRISLLYCLPVKIEMYKIKNQLITAQP